MEIAVGIFRPAERDWINYSPRFPALKGGAKGLPALPGLVGKLPVMFMHVGRARARPTSK